MVTGGWLLWTQYWTFGFHKLRGISRLAENQLASQNGFYSMDLQSISGNNINWKLGYVSND